MQPLETIPHAGLLINIWPDPDPIAPEQESTCYIHTSNNRYFAPKMPSTIADPDQCDSWPVYAYVHSGIRLSLDPFSSPWDSGQIGRIFVAKSEGSTELIAQGTIAAWNNYLSDNAYGFTITDPADPDADDIESCWGFDDKDHCISEAKASADFIQRQRGIESAKIDQCFAL